jgi:hypothetical protein
MQGIKTKNQVQVEQQILYNLTQIVEAFPQYTIAQHICHFLRKKTEAKDVYFWSDELLLRKIEAYYDELKGELLNSIPEDDE